MKKRIWILGASDSEMQAIEQLLSDAGESVAFATVGGERVHPGNAYRHDPVDLDAFATLGGHEVIAVECDGTHHAIGEPGGAPCSPDLRIDHHRPGDPGYGLPPEDYWQASSLGQVVSVLSDSGKIFLDSPTTSDSFETGWFDEDRNQILAERDAHLIAAADHCLSHAYSGKCPGVRPDELMAWRVRSRAEFQRRPDMCRRCGDTRAADGEGWEGDGDIVDGVPVTGGMGPCGDLHEWITGEEQLLADIERARSLLREAASRNPVFLDLTGRATDMRGQHVPELPEGAAREGICFVSEVTDRDGRTKVVCQSGTPEQIRTFMEHWAPNEGLVDIYGDPARGFAGGYIS